MAHHLSVLSGGFAAALMICSPAFGVQPGADRQVPEAPTRALATPVVWTAATLADIGWLPPDVAGAAGPTQILTASIGRIRLFDKSGTTQSLNVTTMAFFA